MEFSFLKENNKQAIYSYITLIFTWLIISVYLASKHFSIFSGILQSIFILLWSYFGHVFAHSISSEAPMKYINPHIYFHHNKSVELPRYLELFIESITNLSAFLLLIIVQYILNIHILSTSVILFGAFVYIAIHIFDYSIFGDEEHALHHVMNYCNYSPRVMDVIFNTRCKPDSDYKPMNRELFSTIAVFPLVALVQKLFDLD